MRLNPLKRSFDTMMAMLRVNWPSEDATMTTGSPNRSFDSAGFDAMVVDSENLPDDIDVNINSHSLRHPARQFSQYVDNLDKDQHLAPDPTSTTSKTLTTFPYFACLPYKARLLIWSFAAPAPRTRFLDLHTYNTIDHIPRIRYIPPLPSLFSTNQEARNFSIVHEGGDIINFTTSTFTALFSFHGRMVGEVGEEEDKEKGFYFNFNRDIIWLSARFTAACDTTETFRLTTLSSILPLPTLSRIERLLISYSGLDTYALVGPVLRPYAHLETLYLCMNDKRIKEDVKKLLEKGVPSPGVTAEKVRGMVEQAEDEETDDDEESEEVGKERLAVRAQRRVLEVDLRLEK